MDQDGDWVLVGVVAGAFGVRGEVKVQLMTDFPDRFKQGMTLYAGPAHSPITVKGARSIGDRIALLLDTVADRDAAQAMFETPLYVKRADVVPLPDGRYYHDQIIGLDVFTSEGVSLGAVVDILVTGSNDVYVVRGAEREILVPALKEIVTEIDVPGHRMVVTPMEGLL